MEAFARNLRKFREEKGFSESHMALLLEMNENDYAGLEAGHSDPSVPVLKLLSHLFNIPVADLMSDHNTRETASKPSAGGFSPAAMSESDKDTYIRILENQLRLLLAEKEAASQ